MDENRSKQLQKNAAKPLTLEDYCRLSKEERKSLGVFSDSERDEVEKALLAFPLIDVKIEHYVDGEKEIAVGDILTIKITITQLNVKDGGRSGFVHSNKFPYLK